VQELYMSLRNQMTQSELHNPVIASHANVFSASRTKLLLTPSDDVFMLYFL
jgi:hypothetical protein